MYTNIIADFTKNVKGNITFGAIFPKRLETGISPTMKGKITFGPYFPKRLETGISPTKKIVESASRKNSS